jgi:hypothetical protein
MTRSSDGQTCHSPTVTGRSTVHPVFTGNPLEPNLSAAVV